jgi:hypothetical protein
MRKAGVTTSKYRGVYKKVEHGRWTYWIACLTMDNKRHEKRCTEELQAAKAYNKMCLEHGYLENINKL